VQGQGRGVSQRLMGTPSLPPAHGDGDLGATPGVSAPLGIVRGWGFPAADLGKEAKSGAPGLPGPALLSLRPLLRPLPISPSSRMPSGVRQHLHPSPERPLSKAAWDPRWADDPVLPPRGGPAPARLPRPPGLWVLTARGPRPPSCSWQTGR
jgi:hypothetical protein